MQPLRLEFDGYSSVVIERISYLVYFFRTDPQFLFEMPLSYVTKLEKRLQEYEKEYNMISSQIVISDVSKTITITPTNADVLKEWAKTATRGLMSSSSAKK